MSTIDTVELAKRTEALFSLPQHMAMPEEAESIIDLQLGYEFQAGAAKGLSLLLQVNNANDAKYQEFDSVTGSVNKTNAYGKTVMFGLNYKL